MYVVSISQAVACFLWGSASPGEPHWQGHKIYSNGNLHKATFPAFCVKNGTTCKQPAGILLQGGNADRKSLVTRRQKEGRAVSEQDAKREIGHNMRRNSCSVLIGNCVTAAHLSVPWEGIIADSLQKKRLKCCFSTWLHNVNHRKRKGGQYTNTKKRGNIQEHLLKYIMALFRICSHVRCHFIVSSAKVTTKMAANPVVTCKNVWCYVCKKSFLF